MFIPVIYPGTLEKRPSAMNAKTFLLTGSASLSEKTG